MRFDIERMSDDGEKRVCDWHVPSEIGEKTKTVRRSSPDVGELT